MPEQLVTGVAECLLPGAVDRPEDTREIGSRDQVEREIPVRRELALELAAPLDERADEPADHEHRRRACAVADPAELVGGRQIHERRQAEADACGEEASPEPEPHGAERDGHDHEHARSVLRLRST